MKKITLSILCTTFLLISCQKPYNCECTTTVTSSGGSFSTVDNYSDNYWNRQDAIDECNGLENSFTGNGITSVTKCELQ